MTRMASGYASNGIRGRLGARARKFMNLRWNAVPVLGLPVTAAFLVSACSLAPGQVPPVLQPVAELPGEFAGSEAAGTYQPLEWWKTFADPVLDRVIEEVLASNFDLAGAVARVDQARGAGTDRQGPGVSPAPALGRGRRLRQSHQRRYRRAVGGTGTGFRGRGRSRHRPPGQARPDHLPHRRGIRLRAGFLGPQPQRRARRRSRAAGLGVRFPGGPHGGAGGNRADLPRDRQPAQPAEAWPAKSWKSFGTASRWPVSVTTAA